MRKEMSERGSGWGEKKKKRKRRLERERRGRSGERLRMPEPSDGGHGKMVSVRGELTLASHFMLTILDSFSRGNADGREIGSTARFALLVFFLSRILSSLLTTGLLSLSVPRAHARVHHATVRNSRGLGGSSEAPGWG